MADRAPPDSLPLTCAITPAWRLTCDYASFEDPSHTASIVSKTSAGEYVHAVMFLLQSKEQHIARTATATLHSARWLKSTTLLDFS